VQCTRTITIPSIFTELSPHNHCKAHTKLWADIKICTSPYVYLSVSTTLKRPSIRTTLNIVCATPPTPLYGFHTHTQWPTWHEDDRKDWILIYMSNGTLLIYTLPCIFTELSPHNNFYFIMDACPGHILESIKGIEIKLAGWLASGPFKNSPRDWAVTPYMCFQYTAFCYIWYLLFFFRIFNVKRDTLQMLWTTWSQSWIQWYTQLLLDKIDWWPLLQTSETSCGTHNFYK